MSTRRQFLESLAATGGLAGLLGTLGGCEQTSDRLLALLLPEEAVEPRPPSGAGIDELTHALNRLTWGPRPDDRARVESMGWQAFVDGQLDPASIDDRRCELRVAEIETLHLPRGELYEHSPAQIMADLSRARLLRALHSRRQLHEVMVDFWSDHFNIGVAKGDCRWMKLADDREVVRPHALGRFRDMVRASATSPAMLVYLDGADNKVVHPEDRPNENHARELLELHTLGVHGGYTQRDVMEAARCLSGWTFTHDWRRFFTARVAFDPQRHDDGAKEVLGVTIPAGGGADDLERLLDVVCFHPSTARHIARRLCQAFVAAAPGPATVDAAAAAFADSGGDIAATLRAVFATPEFAASRGGLLKRPMRFVLSALRALDARTDGGTALVAHLERMGHAPFAFPTPDGYPLEPQPWLGSLLWRWKFALDLARGRVAGTRIDAPGLSERMGGRAALVCHLLGRSPTDAEREVLVEAAGEAPATALALCLAAPAFQRH